MDLKLCALIKFETIMKMSLNLSSVLKYKNLWEQATWSLAWHTEICRIWSISLASPSLIFTLRF